MFQTKILAQEPWVFSLKELPNGAIVIIVIFGGVGVQEFVIKLNENEIEAFRKDAAFAKWLADDIHRHVEKYRPRRLTGPLYNIQ